MTEPTKPRGNWADRLRPLRRLVGPIESAQIRRFGRSGLSIVFRTPVLVLETVGRRTGATRITPLAYHPCADGSWLVVGGAGGQSTTADWVANLRARPDAVAIIDRARTDVTAVELSPTERDAAWRDLSQQWPRIDRYEQRARRPLPIFRLHPSARTRRRQR